MNCQKCGADDDGVVEGIHFFKCESKRFSSGEFDQSQSCLIRELRAEVEKWKAYSERLEEAGDRMPCPDEASCDAWDKAKEAKP